MHHESASAYILLVADAEAVLPKYTGDLMLAGITTTAIQPGETLFDKVAAVEWDAIVIEVAVVESALTLIREISQRSPQLTTLLLTDRPPAALMEAGLAAGAYDWLFKPLDLRLLQAAIMRANERRVLRQRLAALQSETGHSPLSHAVNNQLSGILGLAQLHLADPAISEDLRSDFEEIVASARRISAILRVTPTN